MTDNKNIGLIDTTVPAPALHMALTEAKPYMENGKAKGEPKFGGELVFPAGHPDTLPLKLKALEVAKAEWGDNVDRTTIGWPFQKGDERAASRVAKGKDGKFYEGKDVLKARSKYAPKCSWIANGKLVEMPSNELGPNASKFYGGVECLATINFVAMTVQSNKYVVAYLNMLFSTGKGERVGGQGRSAAEAFKGYLGKATTADPTKGGLGDEIPF